MKVTTAMLCDFAQVRDHLLFVSSGGITRIWRNELPGRLGVFLALVVELDARETERGHELQVLVVGTDGERLAEANVSFQAGPVALEVGERLSVPLALDLRDVAVTGYGPVECKVYLDGEHRHDVAVWVQPAPPPPL